MLLLLILFLNSVNGQFPQTIYDIEWVDRCYKLPPGVIYNVTVNGTKYQCSIPEREDYSLSNEDQFKLLERTISMCFSFDNGYYNYVLCPGKNVTQRRIVNGKLVGETVLGQRVNSVKFSRNSIREEFVDGSLCLGKGKRSVTVEYFCLPDQIPRPIFGNVEENNCKYNIKWQVPQLCKHKTFIEWNIPNYIRCCSEIIEQNRIESNHFTADELKNEETIAVIQKMLKLNGEMNQN